ncbi:hypothetical protein IE53DRAFT_2348 [Violaceomyces palustris]|uniref:Uncharacterized protein n=1 Tax=Violaceomyces palustris TaxID=1673888 RepID=A0ACD0P7U9_9BASI|nr:hypothetical protein IE53DRAFT_2348 [Violaceomyces palustris]
MDHAAHDHGGTPHRSMDGEACPMMMAWNTATTNICIVHPSWHVVTRQGFLLSLAVITAAAFVIEYFRFYMRSVDRRILKSIEPSGGHRRRASVLPTTSIGDSSRRVLSIGSKSMANQRMFRP